MKSSENTFANPATNRPSATSKLGLPPGALFYVGAKRESDPEVSAVRYHKSTVEKVEQAPVETLRAPDDADYYSWINVDGIHNPQLIGDIGKLFDVHPILLEKILDTEQRPTFEEMDAYLYVTLKMIYLEEGSHQIWIEQVSFLLGESHLITFQEQHEDVFHPVRHRLDSETSRVRRLGVDYLLFALIDTIIDHYFLILEATENRIEELEMKMEEDLSADILRDAQELKKELVFLRKAILPVREILNQLIRSDHVVIRPKTRVFFKDLYDKVFQAIETIEVQRDMLTGLQELHVALTGQRMNEVMKVLTIIATLFIPLTFVAGIYGMNFQHMPELSWEWGYPVVWGSMIVMAAGLLYFFRYKKWI